MGLYRAEVCVFVCVRGQGGWRRGRSLRVDLRGGGLLVDGLLPQVVAAFVLLLHAVDEEEDEEHGEHQEDGAGGDHSWRNTRSRESELKHIRWFFTNAASLGFLNPLTNLPEPPSC